MFHDWYAEGLIDPNFITSDTYMRCANEMLGTGRAGAGPIRIRKRQLNTSYNTRQYLDILRFLLLLLLLVTWNSFHRCLRCSFHLVLPTNLTMTVEESTLYGSAYVDIDTLVKENTLKFITGTRPMEEYDQFVEDIFSRTFHCLIIKVLCFLFCGSSCYFVEPFVAVSFASISHGFLFV